jgi:hypothetical protein
MQPKNPPAPSTARPPLVITVPQLLTAREAASSWWVAVRIRRTNPSQACCTRLSARVVLRRGATTSILGEE